MLTRRETLSLPLAASLAAALGGRAEAATPFAVAYAGSMGALMDKGIGPAFGAEAHVAFQGIGRGAFALARLIAARKMVVNSFIPITAGPFGIVQQAGLAHTAVPVASTQMCLPYSPQSPHAKLFAAVAAGHEPLTAALSATGLRFGRTDPRTDPQGRNILFTMKLAEIYYKSPGLADRVLGPAINPRQIFAEPSLLARLQAGQIDLASGYLSAVHSQGLPSIALPAEINLGDATMASTWYARARMAVPAAHGTVTVAPQPLVFYAMTPTNAPHAHTAAAFLAFLTGTKGQALFARFGYSPPSGSPLNA
ncbi:MAG: substrate-binding domain-containing protein [Rhodospirillales bacterium]|nr:substrate-binding domain-containing protein [Rhodospirillales bacterium]